MDTKDAPTAFRKFNREVPSVFRTDVKAGIDIAGILVPGGFAYFTYD